MQQRLIAAGIGAALVIVTGAVVAQQTTDGPYVLHEFVSPSVLGSDDARPAPFGGEGAEGESGDESAAAPQRVPGQPPPLTTEATDDEPVYNSDGPVARDEVEAPHGPLNPFESPNVLDDRTDRVNSLTYFANFDPSVIPLKRVVSQNEVIRAPSGQYAVKVDPHPRAQVEVGGTAAPGDETFWGSFLMRTEPDKFHPIASVAPNQRVLQVQTEPEVAVEIIRDRAGNYLLKTKHRGLLRLNMQVAVDPFYFSGEFDDSVQWGDFETFEDSPMLDRQIRLKARAVLRTIGVTPNMKPSEAIRKLVEHYRDFEARPFPKELEGDDLFTSITTSKIGVCRHRSLSFVVAAQSLGIPAHYVNNEAHAFVEVGWPGRGWRRIDLGGAADELNAAADSGRSLHRPDSDSLPRPQRYLEEQQLMEQNGLGGDTGGEGADESGGDGGATEPPGEAGEPGAPGDSADGEAAPAGTPVEGGSEAVEMAGQSGAADSNTDVMTAEMQRELVESMGEPEEGTPPPVFAPTQLQLVDAATSVPPPSNS